MQVCFERGDGYVICTNAANGEALYKEIRAALVDSFGWP